MWKFQRIVILTYFFTVYLAIYMTILKARAAFQKLKIMLHEKSLFSK